MCLLHRCTHDIDVKVTSVRLLISIHNNSVLLLQCIHHTLCLLQRRAYYTAAYQPAPQHSRRLQKRYHSTSHIYWAIQSALRRCSVSTYHAPITHPHARLPCLTNALILPPLPWRSPSSSFPLPLASPKGPPSGPRLPRGRRATGVLPKAPAGSSRLT